MKNMRNKRKDTFLFRIIYHRVTITVIGLVILIFISLPLAGNISKQYKINQEIGELETEISRLQSKNTELKKLMDYLESDDFVEEQARLNLSYKKADESVVVVKPNEEGTSQLAGSAGDGRVAGSNPARPGKNNAVNWWHYFFK